MKSWLTSKLVWLAVRLCPEESQFFLLIKYGNNEVDLFGHKDLCIVCVKDYLTTWIEELNIKHTIDEVPDNLDSQAV